MTGPTRRNVPLSTEVHANAKAAAELLGSTLVGYVETAITQQIRRDRKKIEKAIEGRHAERTALMKRVDKMLGGK